MDDRKPVKTLMQAETRKRAREAAAVVVMEQADAAARARVLGQQVARAQGLMAHGAGGHDLLLAVGDLGDRAQHHGGAVLRARRRCQRQRGHPRQRDDPMQFHVTVFVSGSGGTIAGDAAFAGVSVGIRDRL
ncbi:hypothetical protein [Paracoccus sp. (in: a-proteobacteria)]|uniref:hypothetical protein n=1 Tax=Paracoccus sp. TaxID=267 RepID=UPI0032204F22